MRSSRPGLRPGRELCFRSVLGPEQEAVRDAMRVVDRRLLLLVDPVAGEAALVQAGGHVGHVAEVLLEHAAEVALFPALEELQLDVRRLALREALDRPDVEDA